MPTALRRRVSRLGQSALRASWCLDPHGATRLIFASRHGEFGRTLSIMEALARKEGVSPADFTLSVHHALAGLLSIANGNHAGHTAVAAGRESLQCGLIEAAACLAETPDRPVLLAYYDEPLPEPYDRFNDAGEETVALVMLLSATGDGARLRVDTSPGDTPGAATHGPASELIAVLENETAGQVVIQGERLTWRIERSDAAA